MDILNARQSRDSASLGRGIISLKSGIVLTLGILEKVVLFVNSPTKGIEDVQMWGRSYSAADSDNSSLAPEPVSTNGFYKVSARLRGLNKTVCNYT